MTGCLGIQRHVLYLSHLCENRRWATNMSIKKLVFHINKSLQKFHHPASSKWPFDSPIGGHLKPPKRTLGRTLELFYNSHPPFFESDPLNIPTLWGWKSGRFLTAVTFRLDGVEEQVPLFQNGWGWGCGWHVSPKLELYLSLLWRRVKKTCVFPAEECFRKYPKRFGVFIWGYVLYTLYFLISL